MLTSMDDSAALQHIASQYRAALAMLKQAIQACPEDLWLSTDCHNRFWHIAYHALFYLHLYAHRCEADFRPWTRHKPDSQFLGPRPWARNEARVIPQPYSKEDVLEFCEFCCAEVDVRVPADRLDAESGFHWLPFNRLELHFYNIRHIQHHQGQLADRLRNAAGIGVPWVRMG